MCWADNWLYSWIQGHRAGDRELSKLVAEHILVLLKDVLGENGVETSVELMPRDRIVLYCTGKS